jgi:DNA helicase-2/ATP-dependent DNA helicase PcrA
VPQEFAIADIIKYLIEAIEYEEHLKKSQKEWETRWENIQELINFAARFTPMADEPRLVQLARFR